MVAPLKLSERQITELMWRNGEAGFDSLTPSQLEQVSKTEAGKQVSLARMGAYKKSAADDIRSREMISKERLTTRGDIAGAGRTTAQQIRDANIASTGRIKAADLAYEAETEGDNITREGKALRTSNIFDVAKTGISFANEIRQQQKEKKRESRAANFENYMLGSSIGYADTGVPPEGTLPEPFRRVE